MTLKLFSKAGNFSHFVPEVEILKLSLDGVRKVNLCKICCELKKVDSAMKSIFPCLIRQIRRSISRVVEAK